MRFARLRRVHPYRSRSGCTWRPTYAGDPGPSGLAFPRGHPQIHSHRHRRSRESERAPGAAAAVSIPAGRAAAVWAAAPSFPGAGGARAGRRRDGGTRPIQAWTSWGCSGQPPGGTSARSRQWPASEQYQVGTVLDSPIITPYEQTVCGTPTRPAVRSLVALHRRCPPGDSVSGVLRRARVRSASCAFQGGCSVAAEVVHPGFPVQSCVA
jgi:hypothetical protein